MPAHSLKAIQKIPAPLQEVWDFFSNPGNLQAITPGDMGFKVLSGHQGDRMYAGQLIEYIVKPLWGIPVYWMTEITQVAGNEYFIDEQRQGPYKLWHHQHHFKVIPGGVEMTDIVHYKNPLWLIGTLANSLVVKKRLHEIFMYRFRKTEELFGAWPGGQTAHIIIA